MSALNEHDDDLITEAITKNLRERASTWAKSCSRVVIYSAGTTTRALMARGILRLLPLAGIVDRNPALHGTRVGTVPVYPPEMLGTLQPDLVLVASPQFHFEMMDLLRRQAWRGPTEIFDLCVPNELRRLTTVIGIGRSGTSLLAQILDILGIPFPGCIPEGDAFNPKGYLENRAFYDFLCERFARWWEDGRLPDWAQEVAQKSDYFATWVQTICPPEITEAHLADEELQSSLRARIIEQFDHVAWAGLKSAPLTLVLPAFLAAARGLKIRVDLVSIVRDRIEVVESYHRFHHAHVSRERVSETYDHYASAVEKFTAGENLLTMRHDELMREPVSTARKLAEHLGLVWQEEEHGARILQCVDPGLYHNRRKQLAEVSGASSLQ